MLPEPGAIARECRIAQTCRQQRQELSAQGEGESAALSQLPSFNRELLMRSAFPFDDPRLPLPQESLPGKLQ
jgi:hypothetical protein